MRTQPQHIDDLELLRLTKATEAQPTDGYRRPMSCELHGPTVSPRGIDAPCPATDPEQGYACDREAGHGGSHRAAIETVAWSDANALPGASLALTIELTAAERPALTTDDAAAIAALVDEIDMKPYRFAERYLSLERQVARNERILAHLASKEGLGQ